MSGLKELKENYWKLLKRTRKSGRIAQSVIDRVEATWERFDPDVIKEAIKIHTSRYPGHKESYTIGIMRNLQKQKNSTGTVAAKNSFNSFKQNSYDFEALERELVEN